MKKTLVINNQICCTKCNETKDTKYFYKRPENNSYRGVCKRCSKGYLTTLVNKQEEIEKLYSEGLKQCGKCKQVKKLDSFGFDKYTKHKLTSCCKECISKRMKLSHKQTSLKSKYNITLEEYNNMLIDQDHKCTICSEDLKTKNIRHVHVDHCHTTNKVRSILCSNCNLGLGFFKDNINNLQLAINYLNFHNGC